METQILNLQGLQDSDLGLDDSKWCVSLICINSGNGKNRKKSRKPKH